MSSIHRLCVIASALRLLLLDPLPLRVYSPRQTGSFLGSHPYTEPSVKEAFMLLRRALWALAVAVCLAAPVAVHAQGDYLDVFVVKVKPDKLTDFQALTKKFAEA